MSASLQKIWVLILVLGILTLLLGAWLMIPPSARESGRGLELMVAVVLIINGIITGVHYSSIRKETGSYLTLVLALVKLAGGLTIVFIPLDTFMTFATLMGIYFALDGAVSLAVAAGLRGQLLMIWPAISGAIAVIFSILIWIYLAGAPPTILAKMLGLLFMIRGLSLIIGAFVAKAGKVNRPEIVREAV